MRLRGGQPEVPCVRCGKRVWGLGWGELCPDCLAERKIRARRLAGRISLAATVLMAAYVALRLSAAPMGRLYGTIAVIATYIIVRRIATQVAMEYLHDSKDSGEAGKRGSENR
jgi:hypothetical protein